jgi:hypothetical protein
MLWTALEDPDPVLIFENVMLYNMTGKLDADAGPVGIEAVVRRVGRRPSRAPKTGRAGWRSTSPSRQGCCKSSAQAHEVRSRRGAVLSVAALWLAVREADDATRL